MRNTLFRLARLLSDVSAIRRGRLTRGISRRMAGCFTARLLSQLFR
jgi:hypothetical protein